MVFLCLNIFQERVKLFLLFLILAKAGEHLPESPNFLYRIVRLLLIEFGKCLDKLADAEVAIFCKHSFQTIHVLVRNVNIVFF